MRLNRNKIFQFLKDPDYRIIFGWINKNNYGEIDREEETITISIELFIAVVFVHEWVHEEYPELSEPKTLKMEDYIIKRLTVEEIKSIAKKVIKKAIWDI